jgi:DNA-binding transcriptional regulator YhcF (GntR family)
MRKNHQVLFESLKIDPYIHIPKYEQLVTQFGELIRQNIIQKGELLPSINSACKKIAVSRDTLIAAYKELQRKGVIESRHGKGFYVKRVPYLNKKKVFLLFDVMNGYKETLYRSIVASLGARYVTDIYFHYYNKNLFKKLVSESYDDYDYYIIMPHFNEDMADSVKKIPLAKLIIIDKDIPSMPNAAAVFQEFESDIQTAMHQGYSLLKKYNFIYMLIDHEFQFIPDGIVQGFKQFCKKYQIPGGFIENIENHNIAKGESFIVFTDRDLADIIKIAHEKKYKLGKDIGIISYDETPLKEVLAGGITVMSTDFMMMGKTVARLIEKRMNTKIQNPFRLIVRKSL